MSSMHYKRIASDGRRTETLYLVTGAEAALAVVDGGTLGATQIQIQRGRLGLLYAAKIFGNVACSGFNEPTDNVVPAGSGLPIRAILWPGQSDWDGRAPAGNAALDAPDPTVAARCKLFDLSFDWGPLTEPSSPIAGRILSPFSDAAFASCALTRLCSLLALQDPAHEYLGIPCAMGATSSQDWNSGVADPLVSTFDGAAIFRALVASRIFLAAEPIRPFEIFCAALGQFTTNASSAILAARWNSDWTATLARMTTRFGSLVGGGGPLRTVAARMQTTPPPGLGYTQPNTDLLIADQDAWAAAAPASRRLAQAPQSYIADNIHLSQAGQITMADNLAAQIIAAGWL